MSTLLSFKRKTTKTLFPNEVVIGCTISETAKTQDEVTKRLSDKLTMAKSYIEGLGSYRKDSLKQEQLHLSKDSEYKSYNKEKILGYRGNIAFVFYLDKNDTTIDDLLAILNMGAEKSFNIKYDIKPSKTDIDNTYEELWVKAVNECVAEAQRVTSQITILAGKPLELTEVISSDKRLSKESNLAYEDNRVLTQTVNEVLNYKRQRSCSRYETDCAIEQNSYEPEVVISRDLIEDLFKNQTQAVCEVELLFKVG